MRSQKVRNRSPRPFKSGGAADGMRGGKKDFNFIPASVKPLPKLGAKDQPSAIPKDDPAKS